MSRQFDERHGGVFYPGGRQQGGFDEVQVDPEPAHFDQTVPPSQMHERAVWKQTTHVAGEEFGFL